MTDTERETPEYRPESEMRTRRLSIRGVDYCMNEWGAADAPMFFFLHGWADSGATFQFVVDALAPGWRIVAPDWRGFGQSAHAGESYWFPDYLADLHEILNHYSPDTPVNLVGHSMGGNVCSLYAGIMPERVRAFINLEGFGLSDSDPSDAPGRYRRWLTSAARPPVFGTVGSFRELAERIRKRNPAVGMTRADYVARQWAYEDAGKIHLWADPRHKLPNPVLYRLGEAEACWRNISARVLLVCGADSSFAGQSGSIENLPFPNAEICTIPGVGHMLHFEAPEKIAAMIQRFFK